MGTHPLLSLLAATLGRAHAEGALTSAASREFDGWLQTVLAQVPLSYEVPEPLSTCGGSAATDELHALSAFQYGMAPGTEGSGSPNQRPGLLMRGPPSRRALGLRRVGSEACSHLQVPHMSCVDAPRSSLTLQRTGILPARQGHHIDSDIDVINVY
jgi:hypothetical protein